MYLRPNFSFDPKNDPLLPCHDAGVEFTAGVVLEVRKDWRKFKKYFLGFAN